MSKFNGIPLLSIDFGTQVVGMATYTPGRDPFVLLAGKIIFKSEDQVIDEIYLKVQDECIEAVILGIPYFTDGTESKMTLKVKKFGEKLSLKLGKTPLYHQDETLSTIEAEERMLKDPRFNFQVDPKRIDELSASIILEDFIQRNALE